MEYLNVSFEACDGHYWRRYGVLCFQEYRVSSGSSSTAESVNLAELEGGTELDNTYIKVAHIWRSTMARFTYTRAPNIPMASPALHQKSITRTIQIFRWSIRSMLAWMRSPKIRRQCSRKCKIPDLNTFSILVKTMRFSTIGAIPDYIEKEWISEGW